MLVDERGPGAARLDLVPSIRGNLLIAPRASRPSVGVSFVTRSRSGADGHRFRDHSRESQRQPHLPAEIGRAENTAGRRNRGPRSGGAVVLLVFAEAQMVVQKVAVRDRRRAWARSKSRGLGYGSIEEGVNPGGVEGLGVAIPRPGRQPGPGPQRAAARICGRRGPAARRRDLYGLAGDGLSASLQLNPQAPRGGGRARLESLTAALGAAPGLRRCRARCGPSAPTSRNRRAALRRRPGRRQRPAAACPRRGRAVPSR